MTYSGAPFTELRGLSHKPPMKSEMAVFRTVLHRQYSRVLLSIDRVSLAESCLECGRMWQGKLVIHLYLEIAR